MPKVQLIEYTGMNHPDVYYAARILAFTKNTRLTMDPGGLQDFMEKPEEEIEKELAYMAKTIRTSLEFLNVTFLLSDVSRSTAQQVTRTRTAVFNMQSQRVSDMSDVTWDSPKHDTDLESANKLFEDSMNRSLQSYSALVESGWPLEDARELLPVGVHCNLLARYSLRSAIDLIRARKSVRVQGPYREIVLKMEAEILRVWPWAEVFFEEPQAKALGMIGEVIDDLKEEGAVYKGHAGMLAKAMDLIKGVK